MWCDEHYYLLLELKVIFNFTRFLLNVAFIDFLKSEIKYSKNDGRIFKKLKYKI